MYMYKVNSDSMENLITNTNFTTEIHWHRWRSTSRTRSAHCSSGTCCAICMWLLPSIYY